MKMQRAGLALPKDSELITEASGRRGDSEVSRGPVCRFCGVGGGGWGGRAGRA
jgi:hypothetical protein